MTTEGGTNKGGKFPTPAGRRREKNNDKKQSIPCSMEGGGRGQAGFSIPSFQVKIKKKIFEEMIPLRIIVGEVTGDSRLSKKKKKPNNAGFGRKKATTFF